VNAPPQRPRPWDGHGTLSLTRGCKARQKPVPRLDEDQRSEIERVAAAFVARRREAGVRSDRFDRPQSAGLERAEKSRWTRSHFRIQRNMAAGISVLGSHLSGSQRCMSRVLFLV
jgi:hypothetical protein